MLLKCTGSASEIIIPFSIIRLLLSLLFKVSFVQSEVSIEGKYEGRQGSQGDVLYSALQKILIFNVVQQNHQRVFKAEA